MVILKTKVKELHEIWSNICPLNVQILEMKLAIIHPLEGWIFGQDNRSSVWSLKWIGGTQLFYLLTKASNLFPENLQNNDS